MFDLLDYRNEGRLIVLNRAGSRVGLSTADAEKVLRAPITAQVPSSRDVPLSVNKGVPIVDQRPRHPVSAALRGLAGKHLASGGPTRARGRRRSARGAGRGGR
jgi:pilus assembly protein CpaE